MKIILRVLFILILPFSVVSANDLNEIPPACQPLADRLLLDGFDLDFLSALFTDPRADCTPAVMSVSPDSDESADLYTQFLSPESIFLSKKFLRQNLKSLKRMETRFGVDKEVVVAILLVESRFGEYTGKHRVIPTLAGIALMDSPDNIQKNHLALREMNADLSYEWLEDMARRKADWAYHELKCFLKIIRHEKIDPLEVRGSYAGALGMAQFTPSSYLKYALKKKGLERWLLDREEAVFSIANYLKSHGWKKNLPLEKKKKVVWYYNRSEPYVDTIVQVAREVRRK